MSNQFHEKKLFPDIEELVPAENSDVSRSRYGSDSTKNCSRDCRERVGAGRYRCDSEVCMLHEMDILFFFFRNSLIEMILIFKYFRLELIHRHYSKVMLVPQFVKLEKLKLMNKII